VAIGKKGETSGAKKKGKKGDDDTPGTLNAAGVAAQKKAEASGDEDDAKVENWADKPESPAYEAADKLYAKIQKCYDNQQTRSDNIEEAWNIYNAQPDENATYQGNSQCYIPAVRDSINARVKRTLAQLFPINFKHVDAVGPTGESPQEVTSLIEHYIRKSGLKNHVRADLIAGDVAGQWGLYVDWKKTYRRVTEIVDKPKIKENVELGAEIEDEDDTEQEIETKDIIEEGPDIVPFAAEDLAVYPPTCDCIEDSIASAIKLRMSKDKVQQLVDEGVFIDIDVDDLFESGPDGARDQKVPAKKRSADAGVKTQGSYKYCLVYEVATNLKFEEDGKKEPALVYYYGENMIAGIIKSPWWSGRRPTISAPVENITGSFFGISKVEPVKFLQWNLNDYWNMGMDSAQYALLPIVMTDPLKSPQYQSMVMGLAAIWLTDPKSTKFAQFPALWKDSMQLCQGIKTQIWESMDVNEAMMGKMPQGRKNNQMVGNLQQEQQINITDHAKRYEEMMLNPVVERIFELDQQFRTDAITVVTMGDVGAKAMVHKVEPQQFGQTWFFRWSGTSYQMSQQRIQQMTAAMNVMRGIPPQLLNGRRMDLTPILEFMVEQTFGPELAPKIFIDERNLFTVPPEEEDDMMHNGIQVEIHAGDNHQEHISVHNKSAKLTGDPTGVLRGHIAAHVKMLQEQQQKMMGQQQGGGQPGVPGGGQPGVAGTPRIGAQPGQPRTQGPPGMVHQDSLAGAEGRG